MTTKSVKVAIIGDQFMRAQTFLNELERGTDVVFDATMFETEWPDKPFDPPIEGIAEYQGEPSDIIEKIGDAEICITHLAPLTRHVIEQCPNLRLIGVSRGGPVNVDMAAAKDHNICVVNAPARNASAVAEFTVGAILSQTRLIIAGHEGLKAGNWRGELYRADKTGEELSQLTVGLLGYSAVGRRVAKLLHAFGPKILACDPYVHFTAEDREIGVEQCDFDTLVQQSDILSLHLRLTPETRHIISADVLNAMKHGAYFINTARGELVDQDALVAALKNGKVRGAALDIFAEEPLASNDPILELPNVTLTPHIAGASVYVSTYAAQMLAEQVANFLSGQPMENVCA